MNKRGDITLWQELVKAVPAVFLVLLLVFAGVQIYNATHPEQYSTEKKDLQRIVNEIKDLRNKEETVTVPVFSVNYTLILEETVNQEKKSAFGCNLDYCVCLKKKDVIVLCETFNLRKEFMIGDEKCPHKEFGDYKGVEFFPSKQASTDNPIEIKRNGMCSVSVSNP